MDKIAYFNSFRKNFLIIRKHVWLNSTSSFYPNTRYREQETGDVALENAETGRIFRLASSMSLLFLGKRPEILLSANAFGQVMIEHESLQNIFTSGDCSIYNSSGSNTMTAQSAVRKGNACRAQHFASLGLSGTP